jgi:hypothetical protein
MATAALTLYQVEENLLALADTAELVEPDREEAFRIELEAALLSAADKRDRVAQFLAHLEAQIDFAEAEMKRLRDRKATMERLRERLEGYVVHVIQSLGKDVKGKWRKLEGNLVTLSIKACPASVNVRDETAVPADYKFVTVKLPQTLWDNVLAALELDLADTLTFWAAEAAITVDKRRVKDAIVQAIERDETRTGDAVVPGAALVTDKYTLVRR